MKFSVCTLTLDTSHFDNFCLYFKIRIDEYIKLLLRLSDNQSGLYYSLKFEFSYRTVSIYVNIYKVIITYTSCEFLQCYFVALMRIIAAYTVIETG